MNRELQRVVTRGIVLLKKCAVSLAMTFTFYCAILTNTAAGELRVGVVDVQRVISDSDAGKEAKKKLEQLIEKEDNRLKGLQDELKALRESIERQKSLLSGGAISDRQEELQKKERELARSIEDKREEIIRKNQSEIGRLVKQIDKVVERFSKEKDITIVLEKDPRLVVYASDDLDLTDEIIDAID